jgi:hypothetical protein
MDAQERAELSKRLNSDERNWARMQEMGWTFLTDWTFTSIFPLPSLMKEGADLMDYYCKGKSSKGKFNKFMITFGDHKGHLDLWGKLEEDFQI